MLELHVCASHLTGEKLNLTVVQTAPANESVTYNFLYSTGGDILEVGVSFDGLIDQSLYPQRHLAQDNDTYLATEVL